MATRTVHVQNQMGIHCRPSAVIIKEAEACEAEIQVDTANGDADLRSILGLISLGLQVDDEVTITVTGPDEEKWCKQLADLFEFHFDFPPKEG